VGLLDSLWEGWPWASHASHAHMMGATLGMINELFGWFEVVNVE